MAHWTRRSVFKATESTAEKSQEAAKSLPIHPIFPTSPSAPPETSHVHSQIPANTKTKPKLQTAPEESGFEDQSLDLSLWPPFIRVDQCALLQPIELQRVITTTERFLSHTSSTSTLPNPPSDEHLLYARKQLLAARAALRQKSEAVTPIEAQNENLRLAGRQRSTSDMGIPPHAEVCTESGGEVMREAGGGGRVWRKPDLARAKEEEREEEDFVIYAGVKRQKEKLRAREREKMKKAADRAVARREKAEMKERIRKEEEARRRIADREKRRQRWETERQERIQRAENYRRQRVKALQNKRMTEKKRAMKAGEMNGREVEQEEIEAEKDDKRQGVDEEEAQEEELEELAQALEEERAANEGEEEKAMLVSEFQLGLPEPSSSPMENKEEPSDIEKKSQASSLSSESSACVVETKNTTVDAGFVESPGPSGITRSDSEKSLQEINSAIQAVVTIEDKAYCKDDICVPGGPSRQHSPPQNEQKRDSTEQVNEEVKIDCGEDMSESVSLTSPCYSSSSSNHNARSEEERKEEVDPVASPEAEVKTELSYCDSVIQNEMGGQVVDYSDVFQTFEEVFAVVQDGNKLSKDEVTTLMKRTAQIYGTYNRIARAGEVDDEKRILPSSTEAGMKRFYRVHFRARNEVYNIVKDACSRLAFEELPKNLNLQICWNLLWTWTKPRVDRTDLLCWQRVNHFEESKYLTRKDLFKNCLQRVRALSGAHSSAFDIQPTTFILPKEYLKFVRSFSESSDHPGKNIWIMKPVGLSRGRGISLIADISDVSYGQSVIIQRYIPNPLTLDGFKFDLRLYVLVTSFQPLEAYIYEEGFVRVCTRAYSTDSAALKDLRVHLTNSSIQQVDGAGAEASKLTRERHSAFIHEAGGTKLSLSYLWRRLQASGVDVASLQSAMEETVVKSLVCAQDHFAKSRASFELYGYDVLIDSNLKPWLIEINSSPSMALDNELDHKIKRQLIHDTLRLINPLPFDRKALEQVLSRRLAAIEEARLRPYLASRATASDQLNRDLTAILRGAKPRPFGRPPEHTGGYRSIAPHTPIFRKTQKLVRRGRSAPPVNSSQSYLSLVVKRGWPH